MPMRKCKRLMQFPDMIVKDFYDQSYQRIIRTVIQDTSLLAGNVIKG